MAELNLDCPSCGRVNEAHDEPHGAKPEPGDVSICWGCSGLAFFTEDLSLRAATEPELELLLADDGVVNALLAMSESATPAEANQLREVLAEQRGRMNRADD